MSQGGYGIVVEKKPVEESYLNYIDSHSDVESYIIDTYGKFKKLDNGNYYIKAKDGTEIYIPSNFSSETKVHAFIPGKGGPASDASRLRAQVESSDPGNYLTIIAPNSKDSTNVLKQATKIINDNGSEVKGIVVSGFSLGGRQTLPTLNEELKEHPELAKSTAIIMTDGWIKDYYKRTDLDELKKNNIQILYVSTESNKMEDKRNPKVKTIIKQLTSYGFNAVGIMSHDYGHQGINNDVIANGFVEFLFDDSDAIGNKNVNTKKLGYDPSYEFIVYNPSTDEFESLFKVGENTDFNRLSFMKLDFAESFVIESNSEILQQYLTNINVALKILENSVFNLKVTSNTAVPLMEVGLVKSLKRAILSLTVKLHNDLVKFGKVGRSFKNLDLELEEESYDLMRDFITELHSPTDPIEINIIDKEEYTLAELIDDYKQYEKERKKPIRANNTNNKKKNNNKKSNKNK